MHTLPGIEQEKVEEAHGQRLFKLPMENKELDFGVTEANSANADPRIEFEEDPEAAKEDAGNVAVVDDQNDVIILNKAPGYADVSKVANGAVEGAVKAYVAGVAETGEAPASDVA